MFKVIGIVAVSSCICIIGFVFSARVKGRLLQEEAFIDFICFLRPNVASGVPLHDIFCSYSAQALEKTGFLTELRKNEGSDNFYETFLKFRDKFLITEAEKEYLLAFANSLGKSRFSYQGAELCKRYEDILSQSFEKSKKENENKIVLYKKIGVICAFVAASLLI